jgi:hypothetical protein
MLQAGPSRPQQATIGTMIPNLLLERSAPIAALDWSRCAA